MCIVITKLDVCRYAILYCLVFSRVWGNGYGDYYWGLYRGYCRDPFPHSLPSTRQFSPGAALSHLAHKTYSNLTRSNPHNIPYSIPVTLMATPVVSLIVAFILN